MQYTEKKQSDVRVIDYFLSNLLTSAELLYERLIFSDFWFGKKILNAPNIDFMWKINRISNMTKNVCRLSLKKQALCRNMLVSFLTEIKQIVTKNWRQHRETYLIDICFISNAVFIIKRTIQTTLFYKKIEIYTSNCCFLVCVQKKWVKNVIQVSFCKA